MIDKSFFRATVDKLLGFVRARNGNVAMTFALAAIPLVGFTGAAVDYSRANSARTALQSAIDAAALILSREASTLTAAQITQKAQAYVEANMNRKDVKGLAVTSTFNTTSGGELAIHAQATLDTTITGLIGVNQLDIAADATIKWGNTRLRVAMVLDTTGSMNDSGKMPALKTAAKNLLTQLQGASANAGDVYVSIIPFSKNVNVGAGNYTANWIDWTSWEAQPATAQSWISSNASSWAAVGPGSTCPFTNSTHGFRCQTSPTNTTIVSSVPSSGTYSGYICPSPDTGQKDSTKIGIMYNGCYTSVAKPSQVVASGSSASCGSLSNCTCSGSGTSRRCTQTYPGQYDHTWVINARSTWTGCVADRGTATGPSNDYDRKVTAPTTSITATLFPAEQNQYCSPQSVTALNYNWATMKTTVDSLTPQGATNQPIGLVWGWQSLVGGGPFPTPPVKDPNFQYKEVIILMSDGLNTLDRWYGDGSSVNTSVDKRMYETASLGTCANVKGAGITVYAVQVNTGGDPMSTLLQNCATTVDKFWMVTSGSALNTVFNQIGTELSQLRIVK